MPFVSKLGQQITETIASLEAINVQWALNGGLALTAYKVVRATQDVTELREYFRLFDKEAMLDELIR